MLIEAGVSAEDAIRAATINPARLLGLESTVGRVAVGTAADLVVFAADWTVDATIVDGQVVYRRDATMGVRGLRADTREHTPMYPWRLCRPMAVGGGRNRRRRRR